jgi:hypothetical protein
MKDGTKSYLKTLLTVLLIPVVFIISFSILFGIADASKKRDIDSEVPAVFPIIVMTSGMAQVVWKGELSSFLQEHPDYSFLVPLNKVDECRGRIQSNTRSNQRPLNFDQLSPIPWSADFTVKQLSDGRQSFEVNATFDDDRMNIGWYEATEKEIFPKYHKFYFGPGLVLGLLPIAAIITGVICTLGMLARKLLRKRSASKGKA